MRTSPASGIGIMPTGIMSSMRDIAIMRLLSPCCDAFTDATSNCSLGCARALDNVKQAQRESVRRIRSVLRGLLFDVIDDDHGHIALLHLQLESELLFDGGEDR